MKTLIVLAAVGAAYFLATDPGPPDYEAARASVLSARDARQAAAAEQRRERVEKLMLEIEQGKEIK